MRNLHQKSKDLINLSLKYAKDAAEILKDIEDVEDELNRTVMTATNQAVGRIEKAAKEGRLPSAIQKEEDSESGVVKGHSQFFEFVSSIGEADPGLKVFQKRIQGKLRSSETFKSSDGKSMKVFVSLTRNVRVNSIVKGQPSARPLSSKEFQARLEEERTEEPSWYCFQLTCLSKLLVSIIELPTQTKLIEFNDKLADIFFGIRDEKPDESALQSLFYFMSCCIIERNQLAEIQGFKQKLILKDQKESTTELQLEGSLVIGSSIFLLSIKEHDNNDTSSPALKLDEEIWIGTLEINAQLNRALILSISFKDGQNSSKEPTILKSKMVICNVKGKTVMKDEKSRTIEALTMAD